MVHFTLLLHNIKYTINTNNGVYYCTNIYYTNILIYTIIIILPYVFI